MQIWFLNQLPKESSKLSNLLQARYWSLELTIQSMIQFEKEERHVVLQHKLEIAADLRGRRLF
jgi:hypothetical protein